MRRILPDNGDPHVCLDIQNLAQARFGISHSFQADSFQADSPQAALAFRRTIADGGISGLIIIHRLPRRSLAS
jgi:hypothetical protein